MQYCTVQYSTVLYYTVLCSTACSTCQEQLPIHVLYMYICTCTCTCTCVHITLVYVISDHVTYLRCFSSSHFSFQCFHSFISFLIWNENNISRYTCTCIRLGMYRQCMYRHMYMYMCVCLHVYLV